MMAFLNQCLDDALGQAFLTLPNFLFMITDALINTKPFKAQSNKTKTLRVSSLDLSYIYIVINYLGEITALKITQGDDL